MFAFLGMKNKFDVVLIRHAQSTFNHATLMAVEELDLSSNWFEMVKHPEFNKRVTYNKKYMNAKLSEHGIDQVKFYVISVRKSKGKHEGYQSQCHHCVPLY